MFIEPEYLEVSKKKINVFQIDDLFICYKVKEIKSGKSVVFL